MRASTQFPLLTLALALIAAGCPDRKTSQTGTDEKLGSASSPGSNAPGIPKPATWKGTQRKKVGGEVHGYVYAELGSNPSDQIALPDVSVHVRNADTGVASASVRTGTDGYYVLPRQLPGKYQICWAATGFIPGCAPRTLTVSSGTLYPGPTALKPSLTQDPGKPAPIAIRGRARLKGGEPCRVAEPYFGVDEVARVTPIGNDNKPLGPAVRANALGEYVVAGVPAGTAVRVTCQGGEVPGKIAARASSPRIMFAETTINNAAPQIASVKAMVGDQTAGVVAAGTPVTLIASATDADHDKLQFEWKAPEGTLAAQGEKATWTAPARPGTYSVYLLVMDGKGGSRTAHVNVEVSVVGAKITAPTATCSATTAPSCVKTAGVPATSSEFLSFGAFGYGKPSKDGANRYYDLIDPLHKRTTLGGFWGANPGFNTTTGVGTLSAAFLNANDLGFGRDMQCAQNGGEVACCVSNYSGNGNCPDQCAASADLALARDQSKAIATVCMEYSPVESTVPVAPATDAVTAASGVSTSVVKFYVYSGAQADSPRVPSANLDGTKERFVPQLCLGCHGGSYNDEAPTADLGGSFREFDPHTYQYPVAAPYPTQANTFYQLNQLVLATQPSAAIQQLIKGLYSGGPATYNPSFVPPGWQRTAVNEGSTPASSPIPAARVTWHSVGSTRPSTSAGPPIPSSRTTCS